MKKINRILFVLYMCSAGISFAQVSSDILDKLNINNVNSVESSCPITWQTKIFATDVSNKKDSVTIGTSSMGTYGIDTCLGEYLIPPPPPVGIFDFRIIFLPTYTLDASKTDIRGDTMSQETYWMNFQPSVQGPLTFTWDSSSLPVSGKLRLVEDINGTNIDMKNQSSFILNNSGIRYLRIEYELYKTNIISANIDWNLISIPLLTSDMSVSALFDSDVASAFSYNSGYNNVTNLSNGIGYWIKFPASKNYNIYGNYLIDRNINVVNGWNIIGPFEESIPVNDIVTSPPGLLASNFFAFQNGYYNEDTLRPGIGYWIKTNDAGIIMKDTNDSFRPIISANNSDNLNNWVRIEIIDNSGKVSNLYLAESNEIFLNYELPPVPPAGIPDVRFASDKYVEAMGINQNILINSAERPLRLTPYNLKGNRICLKDNIDGSQLNVLLKDNETITLNNSLDNLLLTSETSLPVSYELSQNFPNPFNPSTTISYQIPIDGFVKLVVYNVLGREINLLVNELQQAGKYNLNFNASNLSSGVYYYKIESGSFSQIRSMILLK